MRNALMDFAKSRNIALDHTLNLLPESADQTIFPGCSTLSFEEVSVIKRRILANYQTTNVRQSLPSFDHLLQDLGWISYLIAFETEAEIRRMNGEPFIAEELSYAISLIKEHETFEIDAVLQCAAHLSTGNVIESVIMDLTYLIQSELLSCTYRDLEDNQRFLNKPRTGFSVVTMM